MDLWQSVTGMTRLVLESSQPQAILEGLNESGIEIYRMQAEDELTCSFTVRRKDCADVIRYAQKYGAGIKVHTHSGVFYRLSGVWRRPVLIVCMFVMLLLVFCLPTRIFFVEIQGNRWIPDKQILEAAEKCGIGFGASRRAVRSEQVKNAILEELPQLQWAGVNTRGCVAVVSVREREAEEAQKKTVPSSSMVAGRDGYILAATAETGDLLVQPGQSVSAGDVLIRGYYEENGIQIARGAVGEVYAQTNRTILVKTPVLKERIIETGRERIRLSLLIGKKRINLWKDSGILDSTCGRMYKEYYITLPGSFRLPLGLCVERMTEWITVPESADTLEPNPAMKAYAEKYLLEHMIGGTIETASASWGMVDSVLILQENCVCSEMIGRIRQDQIGAIHE